MSNSYEPHLVDSSGTTYEQFAVGVVATSLAAFVLAAGTLFGWVPLAEPVGGVAATTYFGAGTLVLGVTTGLLGLFSRREAVRTTPDRSAGLGVGVVQTVIWTLTAGLFASHWLGLGRIVWLVGILVGLSVGYATIASREDIGATLPTAAFVGVVAVAILGGVISPGWTWEPAAFGATIPGTVVIPLLTMFGSLLTGWASASAYAGFGTRGRENGAFLLISLVVLLTISVLVFLLVFVFERGISVVTENLTIGAGTILLTVGTSLVLLARFGTVRPDRADGTDKIAAFVGLATAVVLGLVGAGFLSLILRTRTVSGAGVTVTPTGAIGAIPGLIAGAVLLTLLRQSKGYGSDTESGRRIDSTLRVAVFVLAATVAIEFFTGSELSVAGIAIVPTVVYAVVAVVIVLLGVTITGHSRTVPFDPGSVPPLSRVSSVGLVAFLVACLHVTITGFPLGTSQFGIVAEGTIDWPFVMNPSQGLGIQKGVMPAMFGTIWIVLGAVVFAVPLAVGAAVYLTEYAEDSMFTQAVDIATNGLWSTPSIVFGLFGLAFLVPRFGGSPSILASQFVLGFMLLPLVLITSREAMKSVPDEYRDASAALGVSKWDTIRSVVIPAAMPGVITGVILGVGRIAGETAPLLLVLNGPNFPNSGPNILSSFAVGFGLEPPFITVTNPALLERASALPYQLYAVITAGVGAEESFGWGTTLVLLGVVLGFFAMSIATRRYFRRKLHQ